MKLKKIFDSILMENVIKNNKWYHGSPYEFTNMGDFKSKGASALGIFVTDDKGLAEMFGDNVYICELTINNPKKIEMEEWNDIRDEHHSNTDFFINMRKEAIKDGHDCVHVNEDIWFASSGMKYRHGHIIAVFDKNNIKIIEKI